MKKKVLKKQALKCQAELQMWGRAKQITFEPTKESISIISNHDAERPDFKLMGLWFDTGLSTKSAVNDVCNSFRWQLARFLPTSRVFDTAATMMQFKTRILSYIEHRTAAIYYAESTIPEQYDKQYDPS